MFDGAPNGNGKRKDEALLHALYPAFELTVLIRPRLLLVAPTGSVGLMILGLLYHAEKDAFQSRLRFDPPGLTKFCRRTKWKQWSDEYIVAERQENIVQLFTRLAHSTGVVEIVRVQFAAHDSDAMILRRLRTSPIAALVR